MSVVTPLVTATVSTCDQGKDITRRQSRESHLTLGAPPSIPMQ